MFQFFEAIGHIFTTAVDFVVGLFAMLLSLVKLIFNVQLFLFEVVSHLPPFLIVFALGFISLAILFQVLNKGS